MKFGLFFRRDKFRLLIEKNICLNQHKYENLKKTNKKILILFQGEYIAPERIENIYIQSKYVAQVFVYGNGYKVE